MHFCGFFKRVILKACHPPELSSAMACEGKDLRTATAG